MFEINNHLFILIVGAISSFLFVFPGLRVARLLKIIDLPSSQPHKIHTKPTPLAGGLALFSGLVALNVFFSDQWEILVNAYSILAALVIFIIGVIDDKYILKPHEKLLGQGLSSLLLVVGGFHTAIFLNYPYFDIAISVFWFLGIINAFNFLDSSDGVILEIGIVITLALMVFTGLSGQLEIQLFCFGFLGLQIGLLYFNLSPAKLFLGDSGAQLIGMILAVLTLMYNPLGHDRSSSWITPILMMSVPIFDVTMVVFSRISRRIAIYSGGLDHSFHRLVRLGFTNLQANIIILLSVAVTNSIAYFALKVNRIIAYIILGLAITTGAILIFILENYFSKNNTEL